MRSDLKTPFYQQAIGILNSLNSSEAFAMGKVEESIRKEAKAWTAAIVREESRMSASDLLLIAGIYDPIHRLATGKAASKMRLHAMSDRILRAYLKGDSELSKQSLLKLGASARPNGPVSVSPAFTRWCQANTLPVSN